MERRREEGIREMRYMTEGEKRMIGNVKKNNNR